MSLHLVFLHLKIAIGVLFLCATSLVAGAAGANDDCLELLRDEPIQAPISLHFKQGTLTAPTTFVSDTHLIEFQSNGTIRAKNHASQTWIRAHWQPKRLSAELFTRIEFAIPYQLTQLQVTATQVLGAFVQEQTIFIVTNAGLFSVEAESENRTVLDKMFHRKKAHSSVETWFWSYLNPIHRGSEASVKAAYNEYLAVGVHAFKIDRNPETDSILVRFLGRIDRDPTALRRSSHDRWKQKTLSLEITAEGQIEYKPQLERTNESF